MSFCNFEFVASVRIYELTVYSEYSTVFCTLWKRRVCVRLITCGNPMTLAVVVS